jgi:hypothetical protein
MRAYLLFVLTAAAWAEGATGTWKLNLARSTFTGEPRPKSVVVRTGAARERRGFTVDESSGDGRATTSSTILYLDSKTRDFQEGGCTGGQSSRRVDEQTVECS